MLRTHAAIAGAGFRRYSTYRQATIAGAFTNVVFGFLRCYVLLAVAQAAGGEVGGYTPAQLAAYVWLGQGLLAVVDMWTMLDLAERVRSGDVVADLLRPIDPLWTYLATDLGRAGFAMLTRFVVPTAVGLAVFDFHIPADPVTYPMLALSILLALVISFAGRYLIGLSAFWLYDIRGMSMFWGFVSSVASGLTFPLSILPDWLYFGLWACTPFPSMLQGPVDVAVERGNGLIVLAVQVAWAIGMLLCCRIVSVRAVRRLVIQGG